MSRSSLLMLLGLGAFLMGAAIGQTGLVSVERKLNEIVIPEIAIKGENLATALEIVRTKAAELDQGDPGSRGIRIGFDRQSAGEEHRLVFVEEKSISVGALLDEIGKQMGRDVTTYHDGVVLQRLWVSPPRAELAEGEMRTMAFRLPPHFLEWHVTPRADLDDPFALDDQPEGGARKSRSIQTMLEGNGIEFEEGAWARYYSASHCVAVHNTIDNLELAELFLDFQHHDGGAATVLLSAEVYSVTPLFARELARRAAAGESGASMLKRIDGVISEGEANIVAMPSIRTRSGQRAKVASGNEFRLINDVTTEGGKAVVKFEDETFGTTLEVDPVVNSDNASVEVNIAIAVSQGDPIFRTQKVELPGAGGAVELEMLQVKRAQLVLATSMTDGRTQFLGVLTGREGDGRVLVAFGGATIMHPYLELTLPK